MKPEALDAMASRTMRPAALDAATTWSPEEDVEQNGSRKTESPSSTKSPPSPNPPASPINKTDPTATVGQVVDGVVNGVKSAIDGVLSWAEEKVEELAEEQESTGPYSSPALCAPSDLDPIASGVLPGMPSDKKGDRGQEDEKDPGSKANGKNVTTERKS